MSQSGWGQTPPDIVQKLAEHDITDPDDLPSDEELIRILGRSDTCALHEELGHANPPIHDFFRKG